MSSIVGSTGGMGREDRDCLNPGSSHGRPEARRLVRGRRIVSELSIVPRSSQAKDAMSQLLRRLGVRRREVFLHAA